MRSALCVSIFCLGCAAAGGGRQPAARASEAMLQLDGDQDRRVRRCFHTRVAEDAEISGELVLGLDVNDNHLPEKVQLLEDRLDEARVAACVIREIQSSSFPTRAPGAYRLLLQFVVPKTIAVFPFENATGNEQLDWMRSALADALTSALVSMPQFVPVERLRLAQVIDELAIGQAGLIAEDKAIEAGQFLQAGLAVVGTFVQTDETLRVSARVVDVKRATVLVTAQYEEKSTDTLAAVDGLARAVTGELEKKWRQSLAAPSVGRLNNEVLVYLGRARNALYGIGAKRDLERAIHFYEKVLAIDPELAEAHVGLAEAVHEGDEVNTERVAESLETALRHLRKATELDPQLYSAWKLLAYLSSMAGEKEEARNALQKMTALAPSHPHTWGLACGTLPNIGVYEDALWACREAQLLMPDYDHFAVLEFLTLGAMEKWTEAAQVAARAFEKFNSDWVATHRVWVLAHANPDEAVRVGQENIEAIAEKHGVKWHTGLRWDPSSGKSITGKPRADVRIALTVFGMTWAYAALGDEVNAKELFAYMPAEAILGFPMFRNSAMMQHYMRSYWRVVGPVVGVESPLP